MASPKQIKCPECNAILKIDDANYASIINQVRDQLFEDQLNKRIKCFTEGRISTHWPYPLKLFPKRMAKS